VDITDTPTEIDNTKATRPTNETEKNMPQSSTLTMLPRPTHAALDSILHCELDVLFALAKVDPFSPTLNLVVAPRNDAGTNGRVPVYRVSLNPFEQLVERVGTLVLAEAWLSADNVDPLLRMDFGLCPSLILIHNRFTPHERTRLTERLLGKFPEEVARVCANIKAHYGDPWSRISTEILGGAPPDDRLDLWNTVQGLAGMQSQHSHVEPEVRAFLATWNGSISIPRSTVTSVLPVETIGRFLTERVAPSVWLPSAESVETGQTKSDEQSIRAELHTEAWRNLEGEELLDFAFRALVMYGSDNSTSDISQIAMMYVHVREQCSESMRMELVSRLEEVVRDGSASEITFLPIVIVDDAESVVAKATIELVSYSPCVDGSRYVFQELHPLMKRATILNRGAVVGALISMGEATFQPHIDKMRALLVRFELEVAARISTHFVQHHAVQYWLRWAESVVDSRDNENEGVFGVCASALFRLGQNNPIGRVFETVRHFPTVEPLNEWSAEEYAINIAPVLYRLESRERPPKVMPHVLTAWGLTPKSPCADWSIESSQSSDDPRVSPAPVQTPSFWARVLKAFN